MRALAIHEDVIVVVSGVWQTTCTAMRAGGEGLVIDSPILPDELEALPGLLDQAGFPVDGLLASHGDWDHLLGRIAFPQASLGLAESTVARLDAEPGEPQRRLREFDAEFYLDGRRALGLAGHQPLPVPGRVSLGSAGSAGGSVAAGGGSAGDSAATAGGFAGRSAATAAGVEIELHQADGHTADGVAFWLPWAEVLVCGDYLSPVELPMISAERGGSLTAYRETLFRLSPLINRAATVVPGHGTPLTGERALELLAEDLAYLDALASGVEVTLPHGRRTATQRQIHERNLTARA